MATMLGAGGAVPDNCKDRSVLCIYRGIYQRYTTIKIKRAHTPHLPTLHNN